MIHTTEPSGYFLKELNLEIETLLSPFTHSIDSELADEDFDQINS